MNARSISIAIALLAGLGAGQQAFAQGMNNFFLMGYDNYAGLPWGGTDMDLISGTPNIYYHNREIGFGRTAANISSSSGTVLFSTNGAWVADALGDTMQNGTGLSPSFYTSLYPDGLHVCQTALIIPRPEATGQYYIFHCTIDDQAGQFTRYLYFTEVDMTQNNGLGAVLSKNNVILQDTLNVGKISAVRHANGRDWWVTCNKLNSNIHITFLVTPFGIEGPFEQAVGILRHRDSGQVCFSPNGDRFAYYYGAQDDLEVFDFDRCTGLLSNPVHIAIDDENGSGGVAFSPSGQFLYVSSVMDVYQYDVTATDIGGSMVHVATWDGFYSPSPPLSTLFTLAQLAPDGKIYISTGNGTFHLHVINQPDLPGLACDFQQHAIELPTYNFNSLPNHPNYFLGPVDGSVCDSLGINTLTPGPSPRERGVSAYPNPSTHGYFTLSYPAQPTVGELEVRDAAGRVVLDERIPQWSTMHQVELAGQAAGMYQCKLIWAQGRVATHIILER